jgi:hypothetical protein
VFYHFIKTEKLTVETPSRACRNRVFCVKNGAACVAALKIPFFTNKAISVNYFASAPGQVKLSY